MNAPALRLIALRVPIFIKWLGRATSFLHGSFVPSLVLAALILVPGPASAQIKAPGTYDPAFVEQILRRLEAQEKELKELRAANGSGSDAPSDEVAKPDLLPQLAFHGFGDISYRWDNEKAGHRNSFALGQLDFFVTSQLADNLSVLGETVIEADSMNNFAIEIERLLLQWRLSEYFNLDMGRYHTAVGYYNTAYHHGSWFQTAAGRPSFLDFEDGGGLIPAHNVGLSMNGHIPSGSLNLSYIAEVGNGRPYRDPSSGHAPVLNISDDNEYKAVNLAFIARPDWASGLQVGAGLYFDRVAPERQPRTDELMLHAHAVYKSGPWEFLSEGYFVRHTPKGGSASVTPAFFAQMARKFGVLTPYARFAYVNASEHDAVWQLIGSNGLRYGPGVGLRWDFSSLAAIKVQYDLLKRRGFSDLSTLTWQVCFTF